MHNDLSPKAADSCWAPAFKEWQVIVAALGAGAQTLILRKGGIAEGRGGFRVTADRFWLFPTQFHAQREKTKPAAARYFSGPLPTSSGVAAAGEVTLEYYADLVEAAFLTDWDSIAALDRYHLWSEATVRERYEWSKPAGVHVLVVRVHRLEAPVTVEMTPQMAGCKSWVELPLRLAPHSSRPVLNEEAFAAARPRLLR